MSITQNIKEVMTTGLSMSQSQVSVELTASASKAYQPDGKPTETVSPSQHQSLLTKATTHWRSQPRPLLESFWEELSCSSSAEVDFFWETIHTNTISLPPQAHHLPAHLQAHQPTSETQSHCLLNWSAQRPWDQSTALCPAWVIWIRSSILLILFWSLKPSNL